MLAWWMSLQSVQVFATKRAAICFAAVTAEPIFSQAAWCPEPSVRNSRTHQARVVFVYLRPLAQYEDSPGSLALDPVLLAGSGFP